MKMLHPAIAVIALTITQLAAGQFIDLGVPVKQAGLRARMTGPT